MTQEITLAQWTASLLAAFEIPETEVDVDAVLALAGVAAHSVVRPAAPLTTYIAGYAAGLAVGAGQAQSQTAQKSALAHAGDVARAYSGDEPAADPRP